MIDEVQSLPVSMLSAYGSTLQQLKLSASAWVWKGSLRLLLLRWGCGAALLLSLTQPCLAVGFRAGREG